MTHPALTTLFSCSGSLTLDGHPTLTEGWAVTNLTQLWLASAHRGTNVVIPGRQGTLPYRLRYSEQVVTLPMIFSACVDQAGAPFGGGLEMVGLQANVTAFHNWFLVPPAAADGARAAVLTMPDATTRTGRLQVLALHLGADENGELYRASLDVRVPAGLLV